MNLVRALGASFGVDPDRFEAIVAAHESPDRPTPDPATELIRELRDAVAYYSRGKHADLLRRATAHLREHGAERPEARA